MDANEIIEGNRLIAEFMGYDFIAENSHFIVRESDYLEPYHHKFNSSWDWLMPVVEKIETLGYHVQIGIATATAGASNTQCAVISKFTDFGHYDMYNKYFYPPQYGWSSKSTKIESCWNACIEFIKWYNNQKQN